MDILFRDWLRNISRKIPLFAFLHSFVFISYFVFTPTFFSVNIYVFALVTGEGNYNIQIGRNQTRSEAVKIPERKRQIGFSWKVSNVGIKGSRGG